MYEAPGDSGDTHLQAGEMASSEEDGVPWWAHVAENEAGSDAEERAVVERLHAPSLMGRGPSSELTALPAVL